ncbi:hydrogen peroxide-inducible activator [Roseibium sp. TrichSKD4]|uniref:hydrogen peroxide-inducible genes activator n=1 Tax=Roseibium sp. TrichSKD4 TaxID=744980 RepID=UPI0001E57200|nr:hydrogen peroxide-inducible genes activator [Roseibium sp. TrichSKD4]EFO29675.1 hydrogen peroxide-inducible activator [Roseibium sp. TrichSKD4]
MAFRPSPRQIEYFIALAETRHFGAAARKCHVSQPTLSAQFKLLEDQLGVTLFERGSGLVEITPVGQELLPLARQALDSLDALVSGASSRQGGLGGLIKLGAASTFGPYFLPHLLPRIKAVYPDLEIYIREDRPTELGRALQSGALDCALAPAPSIAEQSSDEMICQEDVLLGIPADHPLASVEQVELAALNGVGLLCLGPGYQLYHEGQLLCRASGAHMLEDYEGTSLDALRQMVSIGMGLALFPGSYVASEFIKEQRVVLRPIRDFAMTRSVHLFWRKSSSRGHHFQKLAELARQTVDEMAVTGVRRPSSQL